MRRTRSIRLILLSAAVATMTLAFGLARADAPSVSIATPDGDTLLNAPADLSGAPLPEGIVAAVQGSVSADAVSVFVSLVNDNAVASGEAAVSCAEGAETCSWSFVPPFAMIPGDYEVSAVASNADGSSSAGPITLTVL